MGLDWAEIAMRHMREELNYFALRQQIDIARLQQIGAAHHGPDNQGASTRLGSCQNHAANIPDNPS
jgi:hypothetical protein